MLATALRSIDPRAARLLRWRVLEARSSAECARALGVGEPAVDIALVRALVELSAELQAAAPSPPSPEQEPQEASALRRALEAPTGALLPSPGGAADLARVAAALRRAPDEVTAALIRAEQAELASPAARRENVLRKTALLALVAAALYLFLTGRGPFGKTPSPRTPAPQRTHP